MDDYRLKLSEALERIEQVQPDHLDPEEGLVVDIRTSDELALGLIPNATVLPASRLAASVASLTHDRGERIVLYCAVGERSAIAAADLMDAGYTNVASLAGGIKRWMALGHPTESSSGLNASTRHRYARHLVLPQVGIAGQSTLLNARVLIVGAGGLGSPAALYLAAAGVGTIGLIDDDDVDVSNLQRQILHTTSAAGTPKTASAAQRLGELNPDVRVVPHQTRLVAANALEIMSGYDIAVDATDNFASRYLLNDASMHLDIPVVHGSVFRFEGQVAVFRPHDSACYRCVFPAPPPADLAPDCAQAGVFGVLPGVIGTLQATEVLKLILSIGEPLVGKMLTYDALSQSTYTLRLKRRDDCPACGGPPPALG